MAKSVRDPAQGIRAAASRESLKRQPQGELDLAGGSVGLRDAARARGVRAGFSGQDRGGGEIEIGMVRQIENFAAELQAPLGVEEKLFLEREVHVEDTRRGEGVAPGIAQRSGRRRCKGAGIKIKFGSPQLLPGREAGASSRLALGESLAITRFSVRPVGAEQVS